jgi:hypothetical protein
VAALDETSRARTWAHWMRKNLESCGFTKTDLRAALDATDNWIDSNQASFNSALPAAFRTTATTPQKTLLFCFVAMRRAGLLKAEED